MVTTDKEAQCGQSTHKTCLSGAMPGSRVCSEQKKCRCPSNSQQLLWWTTQRHNTRILCLKATLWTSLLAFCARSGDKLVVFKDSICYSTWSPVSNRSFQQQKVVLSIWYFWKIWLDQPYQHPVLSISSYI